MTKKRIAVVIPFYQRKAGLLRKAVMSALNQSVDAVVKLIIVDDGSPLPAEAEVGDFLQSNSEQIVLVKQKNAGCYPASNTALDVVSPDTDFVAFLDSDDVWSQSHLRNALWAMCNGYDFYFADFYQLNQTITAFNRASRIRIDEHKRIHESEPIYGYQGDMVDQIVRGNILGTSTIVYNFRKFASLRYRTEFLHTGGEYIFWLQLALGSSKIAFCSLPECRYGEGVNIFSESAWGTDKYLSVASDEIKYQKWIRKQPDLSPQQRAFVSSKIWQKRVNFCRGLVHNSLHGRINLRLLTKHLKLDVSTFTVLPFVPAIVLFERVRRA
jgi:succinoglycan biosynthesis protein ExoW